MLLKFLKNVTAAIFLALFLTCCKGTQTVIKEEIVTRYVDSTIWHTDTSYFEIPVEVYRDYTGLLDTLRLENKYSIAWSAVDTNNMILLGELKSKNIKVPIEYKWKERIIYQDSIVENIKEIQVPVEVEKVRNSRFATACIVWSIVSLILIGLLIYLKIKKPI